MKLLELTMLNEEMVFSSWIEELEYIDGDVVMTLLSGRSYTVYAVPEEIFDEWVTSPSKGKFWHSDIRGIYTTV